MFISQNVHVHLFSEVVPTPFVAGAVTYKVVWVQVYLPWRTYCNGATACMPNQIDARCSCHVRPCVICLMADRTATSTHSDSVHNPWTCISDAWHAGLCWWHHDHCFSQPQAIQRLQGVLEQRLPGECSPTICRLSVSLVGMLQKWAGGCPGALDQPATTETS